MIIYKKEAFQLAIAITIGIFVFVRLSEYVGIRESTKVCSKVTSLIGARRYNYLYELEDGRITEYRLLKQVGDEVCYYP